MYTSLTPTWCTLMMLITQALCPAAAEILLAQTLNWTLGHWDNFTVLTIMYSLYINMLYSLYINMLLEKFIYLQKKKEMY